MYILIYGRKGREGGRLYTRRMLILGGLRYDRGAVVKGVEHIFEKYERQHMSGAGSSPAGSISRDLNSQKLHY